MSAVATTAELFFGVPITKFEKAEDGSLMVEGLATDATLDLDDQVIDPGFARKALKSWFEDWGNVRQMHSGSLPPGGIGVALEDRPDGPWLKSNVYEPGAVLQVEKGGYKAYSVGIARPRIVHDSAAKGGRIVDGVVVEVSLVDRPANPNCKFAITKGAGSDMRILAKAVDLAEPDYDALTTKTGINRARVAWMLGKSATDTQSQREGAKFKLRDSEGDVKFPISDCSDVADAWGLRGSSSLPKKRVERHVRRAASALNCKGPWSEGKAAKPATTKSDTRVCTSCGCEVDDDDQFCSQCGAKVPSMGDASKGAESRPPMQPGEPDYRLRRLHDACCAAFSTDAIKDVYPVLEKGGMASVLAPGAKVALWQLLNQATQADAGTGGGSEEIGRAGAAYKALADFVALEAEVADEDVMLKAHDELHGLFVAVNKDIMPSGSDVNDGLPVPGSIDPGRFRRPYLGAGHQRENGEGAGAPNIPARTHDLTATDFQRGPLGAGQSRPSPSNAKRAAMDAMTMLHDQLARFAPDLCPMDLNAASIPNSDTSMPTPRTMSPEKAPTEKGAKLTPAEEEAKKAERKIKKAKAKAKKRAKAEKAFNPHIEKIAELQATLDQLSREPDPNQAAHRGLTVVNKAADAQAQKRAAEAEHERRQLLEWQSIHAPDPDLRLRAQDRLAAIEKASSAS